jgi:hypothetical protein
MVTRGRAGVAGIARHASSATPRPGFLIRVAVLIRDGSNADLGVDAREVLLQLPPTAAVPQGGVARLWL